MSRPRNDYVTHRPSGPLGRYAARVVGYHLTGVAPGVHVGMPSCSLTLIIALDGPLTVSRSGSEQRQELGACLAGLHIRPTHVHHEGRQRGIQLDLRPSAARTLFGVRAGELAGSNVDLSDVLGPRVDRLRDRLHESSTWGERFAAVEAMLGVGVSAAPDARDEVREAWRLIASHPRGIPVSQIARQVGWSVRHLQQEFLAETGVTPKQAIRLRRFERSRSLASDRSVALADIAARTGYADQAHLAREWRDLAGMPPSRWRREDELAFVQAERPASARD